MSGLICSKLITLNPQRLLLVSSQNKLFPSSRSSFSSPLTSSLFNYSTTVLFSAGQREGGLCGNNVIAIRRENKNRWERRAPISPAHVQQLIEKEGVKVIVQPSTLRAFADIEYKKVRLRKKKMCSGHDRKHNQKKKKIFFFKAFLLL